MHLTNVRLRNYWGYEEAELKLPANGLVVIIGPNNTGKTALISVFDVIADKSPRLVQGKASQPTYVSAVFRLDDRERDRLLAVLSPSSGSATPPDHLGELTLTWMDASPTLLCTEIALSWPGGQPVPVLRRHANGSATWVNLAQVPADGSLIPGLNSSGGAGRTVRELLSLIDPTLEAAYTTWVGNFFHFSAARPAPADSTLRPVEQLEVSGNNLSNVLLWLATNVPPEWEALSEVMTELVPDLGELRTPAQDHAVLAGFYDPHVKTFLDLSHLGTGVAELLMVAYVGTHVRGAGVTVLEEPENHLHHGAQRRLLQLLLAWATERLIVTTTHSSVFLDAAPSEVTILEVSRTSGISEVHPVLQERSELLSRLGVSISDALSGRRALVVEGPSDVTIVEGWFGAFLQAAGVQVISGGGSGTASQLRSFARWIDHWLDRPGPTPRRIVFLRDRDELSPAEVTQLETSHIVKVLPVREIENYLLKPEAVATVLSELTGADVSPETVAEWIDVAIDRNKDTVLLKRVAAVCERSWRILTYEDVSALLDVSPSPSLDEALALIGASRKSTNVESFVTETWVTEEAALNLEWATQRTSLAAGSDVLDLVWQQVGRRYGKQRDALMLLREISAPEELKTLLEQLLEQPPDGPPAAL